MFLRRTNDHEQKSGNPGSMAKYIGNVKKTTGENGPKRHTLLDIILNVICGFMCGVDNFGSNEVFAKQSRNC